MIPTDDSSPKYDGFRGIAYLERGTCLIRSKKGAVWAGTPSGRCPGDFAPSRTYACYVATRQLAPRSAQRLVGRGQAISRSPQRDEPPRDPRGLTHFDSKSELLVGVDAKTDLNRVGSAAAERAEEVVGKGRDGRPAADGKVVTETEAGTKAGFAVASQGACIRA